MGRFGVYGLGNGAGLLIAWLLSSMADYAYVHSVPPFGPRSDGNSLAGLVSWLLIWAPAIGGIGGLVALWRARGRQPSVPHVSAGRGAVFGGVLGATGMVLYVVGELTEARPIDVETLCWEAVGYWVMGTAAGALLGLMLGWAWRKVHP